MAMAKMNQQPKPYAKINLLSRKEKDRRNVGMMESEMNQGRSYSFIKKSNKPMKVGGKVIEKRGTVVSGTAEKKSGYTPKPQAAPDMSLTRGKVTKSYTPGRAFTGHSAYGKDNPDKKDPKFIEDARSKKQDIAYDKEGKPYRAGYTKITKEPDKVTTTSSFKAGDISMVNKKKYNIIPPKEGGMNQSFGKNPKKVSPREKWLRNKDTVTSFERRRTKKEGGY